MAGSRKYMRDSSGRFAGSGGRVTYGKAGGFANKRTQASAQRSRAKKGLTRALVKHGAVTVGGGVIGAALTRGSRAGILAGASAGHMLAFNNTKRSVQRNTRLYDKYSMKG